MPTDEIGPYVTVSSERGTDRISVNPSMTWGHVRRAAWQRLGYCGGDLLTSADGPLAFDELVCMHSLPTEPLMLERRRGTHGA
jgi:hypothetical protein